MLSAPCQERAKIPQLIQITNPSYIITVFPTNLKKRLIFTLKVKKSYRSSIFFTTIVNS